MVVVIHQAIAMDNNAVLFACAPETMQKEYAIVIGEEDRLLPVSP
jgi:hypothetical protein